MIDELNELHQILNSKEWEEITTNRYQRLGLEFNPFPKSGTAGMNTPDKVIKVLKPYDDAVAKTLLSYILQSLYAQSPTDSKDKFLSATITGDYGSGKTQLLLYAKYLLNSVSEIKQLGRPYKKPFVVYIDNPGVKLSELIGQIISEIGEEDFKKFIWGKIIDGIKKSQEYKAKLDPFIPKESSELFPNKNTDPYADENTLSYKKFLDTFIKFLPVRKRKDFSASLQEVVTKVLSDWKDSTIARYYYEFINEDYSVNKTWEILSKGGEKSLDKKEVPLINSIIELVESQGYTDFYILVDEFEDLTEGRLTKSELDNYLRNLRTLIDQNKNWAVIFSMTEEALKKIRQVSPPLADRLTNRLLQLRGFDDYQAKKIINTYLNFARVEESSDSLSPFSEESVIYLKKITNSNLRRFLKSSFELLENFVNSPNPGELISIEFIKHNFGEEN